MSGFVSGDLPGKFCVRCGVPMRMGETVQATNEPCVLPGGFRVAAAAGQRVEVVRIPACPQCGLFVYEVA